MATPTTTGQAVGTIKVVIGEVKVVGIDGTARIAQVGDKVYAHETLLTAANAVVQVQLDNGNLLDLGRDSRLALDDDILTAGGGAGAPAAAAQVQQDVAALQAQIASGRDPTQFGEATAAGDAPAAGGAEGGGSHEPVVIAQANSSQRVTSGFLTEPVSIGFPTPTTFPTVLQTKPLVSVSVSVAVGVEQGPIPGDGPTTTPGVAVNTANVIEGTGAHDSVQGHVVKFILQLDQAYQQDVTVTYMLKPGTATPGVDYLDGQATYTVLIPAGTTQIVVPVTIVGDSLVEPNETFSIVLTDAQNATIDPNSNSAVVTIVDDDAAPVANADTNWAQEDAQVTTSGNVLSTLTHGGAPSSNFADAADTHGTGTVLTVTTTGTFAGQYGTLVLNTDGSYTYTLNNESAAVQHLANGQTLTDTFNYTASDSLNTPSSATLTVTVFGTNDAPVAQADTNWTQEDDSTSASGNVLQTLAHAGAPSGTFGDVADTDVDSGASLTVTVVNGDAANVAQDVAGTYGTLHLNADGSYTYTLNSEASNVQALASGQSVTDSFQYSVSDGTATAGATLTVTVFGTNDAPVAQADTNWTQEDSSTSATGNVLQTLSHSGAPTGTFGDVADTDVDSGALLTVTAVGGDAAKVGQDVVGVYGTLHLNADGTYTYTLNNEGTNVQALQDGQSVTDTFQYTVSDGASTATATLTVTVFGTNDAAVAQADTNWTQEDSATSASGNVLQDLAHTGAPSGTFADVADTDADSSMTLTVSAVNGDAAKVGADMTGTYGTLHLNADGTYTYMLTNEAANVQAIGDGQTATDTFQYTVTDGTTSANATLTITIFGTNDAPVARADTNWVLDVTSGADPTASGNVLQTLAHNGAPSGTFGDVADTDVDVEALTVSAVNGDAAKVGVDVTGTYGSLHLNANGTYTYTLNANNATVNGLDTGESITESFNYTATDGTTTAGATLTITIFGNNDAPTISVLTGGTSAVYEAGLSGGSGVGSTTTEVTGSFQLADADGLADITNVKINSTQIAMSDLVGSSVNGANGTMTITAYNADTGVATYEYTLTSPATDVANVSEENVFTVSVSDNDGTDYSASVIVAITIVDDVPQAADDANAIAEDAVSITGNVLPNDVSGADTPSTFVSWDSGEAQYGSMTQNADGNYTYVLNNESSVVQGLSAGESLDETFTYTMRDADGDPSTATLTITINGTDDGVTITGIGAAGGDETVYESNLAAGSAPNSGALSQSGEFAIVAKDGIATIGVGGEHLTLAQLQALGTTPVTIDTAGGQLVLNGYTGTDAGGTVSYTYTLQDPVAHVDGNGANSAFENFTVTVTDQDGSSDTSTLSVRVVDDMPTTDIVDIPVSVIEGDTVNGTWTGATGADGGTTRVVVDSAEYDVDQAIDTGRGVLTVNNNGTWTFTAAANLDQDAAQDVSFSVAVTDGDSDVASDSHTISITDGSGPAATGSVDLTVAEDDLPNGTDQTKEPLYDSGTLTFTAGSDHIESIVFGDTSAIQIQGIEAGKTVVWTESSDGRTLTGSVDGTDVIRLEIAGASTIAVGQTDNVTVTATLLSAFPHASSPNEDSLSITGITVSASDHDGDAISGNVALTVVIDDQAILDPSDSVLANQPTITVTADLGLVAGADGVVSVSITGATNTLGFAVDAGGGILTSNGTPLVYMQSGGVLYAVTDPSNLNTAVFTLTPNIASDSYTVSLIGKLDAVSHTFDSNFSSTDAGGPGDPYTSAFTGPGGVTQTVHMFGLENSLANPSNDGLGVDGNTIGVGEKLGTYFGGADVSSVTLDIGNFSKGESFKWTAVQIDDNLVNFHNYQDVPNTTPNTYTLSEFLDSFVLVSGDLQAKLTETGSLQTIGHAVGGATVVGSSGSGEEADVDTYTFTAGQSFDFLVIEGAGGSMKIQSMSFVGGSTTDGVAINFVASATDGDGDVTQMPFEVTFAGGSGGNYILTGGSGSDNMLGGTGNDILVGGAGDDTLTAGLGNDTFKWMSGDEGTSTTPAVDIVTDFNNGNDVLNLADLLQGESHVGTDPGNLASYLHFTYDSATNSTVVNVTSTGSGGADQKIVLSGVGDLTSGGAVADNQIIANLLNQAKLITG